MLRSTVDSRFASVLVASALLFGCADDLVPSPASSNAASSGTTTASTSSTTSAGGGGAVASGGAGGAVSSTGGVGGTGGAVAMGGGGTGGTAIGGAGGGVVADVVPDFSLIDDNANSATYGKAVSPRDYLGQVSAFYFGHST